MIVSTIKNLVFRTISVIAFVIKTNFLWKTEGLNYSLAFEKKSRTQLYGFFS